MTHILTQASQVGFRDQLESGDSLTAELSSQDDRGCVENSPGHETSFDLTCFACRPSKHVTEEYINAMYHDQLTQKLSHWLAVDGKAAAAVIGTLVS